MLMNAMGWLTAVFCGLHCGAVSSWTIYITEWNGKDLVGSGHSLNEVTSRHLLGGLRKSTKKKKKLKIAGVLADT
jgi:hypothetical protein